LKKFYEQGKEDGSSRKVECRGSLFYQVDKKSFFEKGKI